MGALTAFARNDLRFLRRDSLMIGVLLGPFVYAAFIWFLPRITEFVSREWDFDLGPYHSLLISAFCVLGPPMLIGAITAMQLLDDRDQHTLSALRVTPMPPAAYPAYRMLVAFAVCTITTAASLAVTFALPLEVWLRSLPVAVLSGLLAPVIGLPMSVLGRNKIEGLAVMRVIGLVVFTVPLAPFFFLDNPWQLAFGVLPPYWPVRVFWSAMDGGPYWPYILGGIAVLLMTNTALLQWFRARMKTA
ncbi:ABC transporter permease [Nocardia mexicana]|uniref:Fluoroquinolone transport system permease protein n=1 Tax=Nocardia mexicana TaxID=279262 RepID=A0A370GR36_9NOCA|nr:ABC transporter permease [Nocardia mexicana]RDI44423.1 fluoroquinolone transport system permease protein [Nocardia mexicana]